LAAVKQQGIKVFIATGRSLKQIDNLHDLTFDGYITMNGAYCVNDRNDLIHKSVIPQEDIEALIRYEERENFPIEIMTVEEQLINFVDEKVVTLIELVSLPMPRVESLREASRNEILQMGIFVDKKKEREIMRKVLVHCHATRWYPIFADINLRGCSKQSGIDHILEYYDIRLDETMCFGDGGNDIPMLRHAAIGVAMGNASDEVKRTADYVTDTVDNDGIWKALKYFGVI
jgi:Cof subfamily protein (haloacid dehalogenase superfamily)